MFDLPLLLFVVWCNCVRVMSGVERVTTRSFGGKEGISPGFEAARSVRSVKDCVI